MFAPTSESNLIVKVGILAVFLTIFLKNSDCLCFINEKTELERLNTLPKFTQLVCIGFRI